MLQEKAFTLDTPDGFTIYGKENWVGAEKPQKTLILMHGMMGNYDRALMYNGMHYFTQKGYHVVRFNFYAYEDKARKLENSGIAENVKDLREVLKAYGQEKVFLAGHSYAGLGIVTANCEVAAQALWDPSHGLGAKGSESDWFDEGETALVKGEEWFIMTGSATTLFEGVFVEERNLHTAEYCNKLAKQVQSPTLICSAGAGILVEGCEDYAKYIPESALEVFAGAGHNFSELNVMQDVFDKTHEWFERF